MLAGCRRRIAERAGEPHRLGHQPDGCVAVEGRALPQLERGQLVLAAAGEPGLDVPDTKLRSMT
jgi:hypothetical protein